MRTSLNEPDVERQLLMDKLSPTETAGLYLTEDFGSRPLDYELRPYYGGDDYELYGYALLLDGTTPIDGSTRASHLLSAYTGTAISRWRIKSDSVSTDELEARWRKAHDDRSLPTMNPLLTQHSYGAYSEHDPNAVRDPRYLIVQANDTPAALALIEQTQRAPTTLGALVKSQAYRDLVQSSAHVRAQLAQSAAKALNIEIDDEPDLVTPTHQIVAADSLAHQAVVANGALRNGQEQYVVHNETIDTSTSHQGALVHQGPMGGYAYLARTKPVTQANGAQSRAWRTDTMSVLGANSPHWQPNSEAAKAGSSESALHRNANAEARRTFDAKVHWSGTLSTAHPRADERRTLINQSLVREVAKPQESNVDIRVVPHKTIAVQLADHEPPLPQTIDELAALARQTKAKSLPVPLNSEAIRDLTRHFDSLPPELLAREHLSDVMANSVRVPLNELHTLRSACRATDPDHYHYWYDHVYKWDKPRDALLDERDADEAGDVDEENDFVEDIGHIENYARPMGERLTELALSKAPHGVSHERTHERIKTSGGGAAPQPPKQTRIMLGTDLINALAEVSAAKKKAGDAAKKLRDKQAKEADSSSSKK